MRKKQQFQKIKKKNQIKIKDSPALTVGRVVDDDGLGVVVSLATDRVEVCLPVLLSLWR